MNTPVKFELAKLLKEKGFDESTHSFFVIDENGGYGEIGEFLTNPNDNYPTLDNNSLFDTLASAPTIAEVVMWLYEKHGIWIEVQSPDHSKELWSFIIHKPYSFGSYGDGNNSNSPTEAYENAIEYTLTKLIS